jgi:hypothetical protein
LTWSDNPQLTRAENFSCPKTQKPYGSWCSAENLEAAQVITSPRLAINFPVLMFSSGQPFPHGFLDDVGQLYLVLRCGHLDVPDDVLVHITQLIAVLDTRELADAMNRVERGYGLRVVK